jgi:hypothetical protein
MAVSQGAPRRFCKDLEEAGSRWQAGKGGFAENLGSYGKGSFTLRISKDGKGMKITSTSSHSIT